VTRIALYCPNKPLLHPRPSGDLTIARSLHHFFSKSGYDCREIVRFRARWFWHKRDGWLQAARSVAEAIRNAAAFRPAAWITYHSYYKSPDVVGPIVSRLLRIPYFLLEPMYATKWRKTPPTRTGFYLNRIALKTARSVFLNNMDDLEALSRLLPAERLLYVSPGIFPEEFQKDEICGKNIRKLMGIPSRLPLVMTAAMFRPGVKYDSLCFLLRSLSRLRDERGGFRLLLVGDGPMRTDLEKMARLCLPGRTVFAGAVPRSEMFSYYSAADIFAFPGIRESIGMVYLEAQACGLPVVALNVRGAARMVENGRTGLLVPAEDSGQAMAEALGRLMSDPDLRRELAENGREYIVEKRNLWKNYQVIARECERWIS